MQKLKNLPSSSNSSTITDFEVEQSPVQKISIAYQNFTHAQNISARLSRNSILNDLNIRVSTPNCNNVKLSYMMQDEVLGKSPMNKFASICSLTIDNYQQNKFTIQTMKKVMRIEQHISREFSPKREQVKFERREFPLLNLQKLSLEDTICSDSEGSSDETEDENGMFAFRSKLQELLGELRILRKDPLYFESYDGDYAMKHPSTCNFMSFQIPNKCGVTVNNGRYLQSIVLERDTFRVERICDNIERTNYSAICLPDAHFSDWVVCGTESGNIHSWNLVKQGNFKYYTLKEDVSFQSPCKPTFIGQKVNNYFVGNSKNSVLMLDSRMKKKCSLLVSAEPSPIKSQAEFYDFNQIQFEIESPRANNKKENYRIMKIDDNSSQKIELEDLKISPLNLSLEQEGVRYIDIRENNVLITLSNGFCSFDARRPQMPVFSYSHCSIDPIKVLFSPNTSNHAICADKNTSKLKVWNLQTNLIVSEYDLLEKPNDILVCQLTKEVLTLCSQKYQSTVKIFDLPFEKLKYSDQITLDLPISSILLDHRCEMLFGMGLYSLRTWKFYDEREMEVIKQQVNQIVRQKSPQMSKFNVKK